MYETFKVNEKEKEKTTWFTSTLETYDHIQTSKQHHFLSIHMIFEALSIRLCSFKLSQ